MLNIHFRTRLQGEVIRIPRELRDRIGKEEVEVFISSAWESNNAERADGLQQLLEHPLGIENFKAPSREEMYDRD